MEVRVASVDGSVPVGCFVGVRIGEVLKQGRYEPSRCYNFPSIDRRKNAKIDIYRHVGSCTIAVEPDASSTHEVKVSQNDPAAPQLKLKIDVASKAVDQVKQRAERTKIVKNQAQDYLNKHSIEEKLSEAVKALLKEQPADPTAFLQRHLGEASTQIPTKTVKIGAPPGKPTGSILAKPFQGYYSANCLPNVAPGHFTSIYAKFPAAAARLTPKVPAPNQGSKQEEELVALRNKAREVLVQASENGGLVAALQDVRTDGPKPGASREQQLSLANFSKTPSVGTWLAPRPPKVVDGRFLKKPSVGTWLAPRLGVR